MAECAICGDTDGLTRKCNYCGKTVCSSHTLPEKHNCPSTRAESNAGKHFESAFEATLDDSPDSTSDSPEPMEKGEVRTYGTGEAVDELDSSPPVETKSNDEDVDEELENIKRRKRLENLFGGLIAPVRGAGGWVRSKLPGTNRSKRRYSPRSRGHRRKLLAAVGLAGLGSSGWLYWHNDGDLGETVEDVRDVPARLSTGGVSSEGAKTFAASENFERVSWNATAGSVTLVVELQADHSMDWFRVRAGGLTPATEVATAETPSEKRRVEIDLLDAFANSNLPSGRWRLEAFEGPEANDARKLGHVVWETSPNLEFEGVPVINREDLSVEIGVKNTGNAPALVKEMTVSDYESVPVGGFALLPPGETGQVNSVGTPFRDHCTPESYTLSVSGTPDSGASIDISSSKMTQNC